MAKTSLLTSLREEGGDLATEGFRELGQLHRKVHARCDGIDADFQRAIDDGIEVPTLLICVHPISSPGKEFAWSQMYGLHGTTELVTEQGAYDGAHCFPLFNWRCQRTMYLQRRH